MHACMHASMHEHCGRLYVQLDSLRDETIKHAVRHGKGMPSTKNGKRLGRKSFF